MADFLAVKVLLHAKRLWKTCMSFSRNRNWHGLGLWCLMPLSKYFSYIVAVIFIGGAHRRTKRKPPNCRKYLAWTGFEITTLVVIGTDCIDSCKSNYHTITTTRDPPILAILFRTFNVLAPKDFKIIWLSNFSKLWGTWWSLWGTWWSLWGTWWLLWVDLMIVMSGPDDRYEWTWWSLWASPDDRYEWTWWSLWGT
jgi:hypothetical protein